MRQDVKELIDAMQAGWNKVPKNCPHSTFKGSYKNPKACCPLGHAMFGKNDKVDSVASLRITCDFPVLLKQKVKVYFGDLIDLQAAIITLADDYNWSTPKVIKWLKSHLEN